MISTQSLNNIKYYSKFGAIIIIVFVILKFILNTKTHEALLLSCIIAVSIIIIENIISINSYISDPLNCDQCKVNLNDKFENIDNYVQKNININTPGFRSTCADDNPAVSGGTERRMIPNNNTNNLNHENFDSIIPIKNRPTTEPFQGAFDLGSITSIIGAAVDQSKQAIGTAINQKVNEVLVNTANIVQAIQSITPMPTSIPKSEPTSEPISEPISEPTKIDNFDNIIEDFANIDNYIKKQNQINSKIPDHVIDLSKVNRSTEVANASYQEPDNIEVTQEPDNVEVTQEPDNVEVTQKPENFEETPIIENNISPKYKIPTKNSSVTSPPIKKSSPKLDNQLNVDNSTFDSNYVAYQQNGDEAAAENESLNQNLFKMNIGNRQLVNEYIKDGKKYYDQILHYSSDAPSTFESMDNELKYSNFNYISPLNKGMANKEYTFISPNNWFPIQPHPPVCVTNKSCTTSPVMISDGQDYMNWASLEDFDKSRRFTGDMNINIDYIKNVLNDPNGY